MNKIVSKCIDEDTTQITKYIYVVWYNLIHCIKKIQSQQVDKK